MGDTLDISGQRQSGAAKDRLPWRPTVRSDQRRRRRDGRWATMEPRTLEDTWDQNQVTATTRRCTPTPWGSGPRRPAAIPGALRTDPMAVRPTAGPVPPPALATPGTARQSSGG